MSERGRERSERTKWVSGGTDEGASVQARGGGEYRRRPRSVAVCRLRNDVFLHGGRGPQISSAPNPRFAPGGAWRHPKVARGGRRVPVSSTRVISGVDGVEKRGRGRRAERQTPWNGERGGAFTGTPVPTDVWMGAGAKIIEVPAAETPALVSSNVCSPWTPLLHYPHTSV